MLSEEGATSRPAAGGRGGPDGIAFRGKAHYQGNLIFLFLRVISTSIINPEKERPRHSSSYLMHGQLRSSKASTVGPFDGSSAFCCCTG